MSELAIAQEPQSNDNEFACMPPEQAVAVAAEMLDLHAEDTDRALALAVALRDRIECRGEDADQTDAVLVRMLVEQLGGAPEPAIKQCLVALLEKCQSAK